jgi:Outer membrane protein
MKRLLITALLALMSATALKAQNTMVVDSEKVFKSVAAYNDAMQTLDDLGKKYDKEIEDAYAAIEKMFNDYQTEKMYLSTGTRQQREEAILKKEKEVQERQESLFGQEGELIKKRVELIKPVQDKVFGVISDYATRNGFGVVIDIASNPTVLFYSPTADKTQQIIDLVK